jgi:hypothetical protein
VQDLKAIAEGLSSLLRRTLDFHFRSAIFGSANDAMLIVDECGRISEANAAAESLLRIPRDCIEKHRIEAFFSDPEDARTYRRGASFPNEEVLMLSGDPGEPRNQREPVKVLLSVASLPEETGGKIFIASDMTSVEREKELHVAHVVYREITAQVKTPMSLAMSWLRRSAEREQAVPQDTTRKVLQQLQKAELTLDRMVLAETRGGSRLRHDVCLSPDDLIETIRLELPSREREIVVVSGTDQAAYIKGDAYEVRYCLLTVISYLLRVAAESDKVCVNVTHADSGIVILVRGRGPAADTGQGPDSGWRSGQVRADMALGVQTLSRLAWRNGGRFTVVAPPGSHQVGFRFAFPAVTEGVLQ